MDFNDLGRHSRCNTGRHHGGTDTMKNLIRVIALATATAFPMAAFAQGAAPPKKEAPAAAPKEDKAPAKDDKAAAAPKADDKAMTPPADDKAPKKKTKKGTKAAAPDKGGDKDKAATPPAK